MKLDVWMEGISDPVGCLERREDKSLSFEYLTDDDDARISMSMPVREESYRDAKCRAVFGNLLSEGEELMRVIKTHGIDSNDIGMILYHLGADCPGAISVTPAGTGPVKRPGIFPDDYEELSEKQILGIVRHLHFYKRLPSGSRDPSPVAGVQPKLALVAHGGRWYLPRVGSRAPTTHILKISPSDDVDLTRHEAALLSLARKLKIPTADARGIEFLCEETGAEIHTLLSTRFDRKFDGREIRRIHAEDLCQALGIDAVLKYERNAELENHRFDAAAVGRLAVLSASSGTFQIAFAQQTIFNLLVGNTDNHGKNASILYKGGRGELAPLYDVVPIIMDPGVTHQFAFDIGTAKMAEDLSIEDLKLFYRRIGFVKWREKDLLNTLKGIVQHLDGIVVNEGGKQLADAVVAQMQVVTKALPYSFKVPLRDYFPRNVRDERSISGGWGLVS